MNDAVRWKRETLSMKIPAEVDAFGASDDSRAAVQTFKAKKRNSTTSCSPARSHQMSISLSGPRCGNEHPARCDWHP